MEVSKLEAPKNCDFSIDFVGNASFEKVKRLFDEHIIMPPHFQNCLPVCGICTQFKSDSIYIIYNIVVIGVILPVIGVFGLWGNMILNKISYSSQNCIVYDPNFAPICVQIIFCFGSSLMIYVSAFVYKQSYVVGELGSGSLYLSALGCSDTCVILTALFLFSVDLVRRYSLTLSILFGTISPIVYPIAMFAQTCSVYFTLIAGIDCFIQMCLPICAKRAFNKPRIVKTTTAAIVAFSWVYNIPHFFESLVLDCWHIGFNSRSLEVCPTELRFNEFYTTVYYQYMYSVFLAVGPLLILAVLNIIILFMVFAKKCASNIADNMALILVVLLFVFCNTIALLINVFEARLSMALAWRINYFIDISNLLVVLNSSMNFLIYYRFSRPFRNEFRRTFRRRKPIRERHHARKHNNKTVADAELLLLQRKQQKNSHRAAARSTSLSNSLISTTGKNFTIALIDPSLTAAVAEEDTTIRQARRDSGIDVESTSCNNGGKRRSCPSASNDNDERIICINVKPSDLDPSVLCIAIT